MKSISRATASELSLIDTVDVQSTIAIVVDLVLSVSLVVMQDCPIHSDFNSALIRLATSPRHARALPRKYRTTDRPLSYP